MRAPRILALVVGSIALAAVLFLFVLPTRTYLSQRQSMAAQEARLHVFDAENRSLSAQAKQLQTTAGIERIAQQQYGLVMPGQQAIVALPDTQTQPAASASKPRAAHKRSLWYRLWHDAQFWN